jgi:hypothetical protein
MKGSPGEWDSLRLAAKAADRAKAAEKLRPGFEKRLAELGYGPRSVAHAFSALSGPDSVADALAELAQNARFEWSRPVALEFEIVGPRPASPADHSLTVTSVERDDEDPPHESDSGR